MIEVKEYQAQNGKNYYQEWLETLDKLTLAKVLKHVRKLSKGLGHLRAVEGKLWELKIDLGPGYRVYFYRKGNELIVLLAGSDKSQQERTFNLARRLIKKIEKEESA